MAAQPSAETAYTEADELATDLSDAHDIATHNWRLQSQRTGKKAGLNVCHELTLQMLNTKAVITSG